MYCDKRLSILIKMECSCIPASRSPQTLGISQQNLVRWLILGWLRTASHASYQGVSTNFVKQLFCIVCKFLDGNVIYEQSLVGSKWRGPQASHPQQLSQIWVGYSKSLWSSGSGNKWVHHFYYPTDPSLVYLLQLAIRVLYFTWQEIELIKGVFQKLMKILVGNKAFENLSVFLISPVTRGGRKLVVEFIVKFLRSIKNWLGSPRREKDWSMLRTALHTRNDDSLSADWKILFAVWSLKGSLWIFKFLKFTNFDFIFTIKVCENLICEKSLENCCQEWCGSRKSKFSFSVLKSGSFNKILASYVRWLQPLTKIKSIRRSLNQSHTVLFQTEITIRNNPFLVFYWNRLETSLTNFKYF